jgi:hypothetical protein
MRRIAIISLFTLSSSLVTFSYAQSGKISTIAGMYYNGFFGDGGQATLAELNLPSSSTIDSVGNIFIADAWNNRIREISASGIINTVVGGGTGPGLGDGGLATAASLYNPAALAFDKKGNMYIADAMDFAVRKVNATTGIITTVAGIAGSLNKGYAGDGGQATAALLDGPEDIALDAQGNIYIADESNNVIRKVTVSTGIITTVAGNGYGYWKPMQGLLGGFTGDGGQATAAELFLPSGIALDDSANIYIADFLNYVIRKVTVSTGIISTVAGNHISGYTGDGGQATSAELGTVIKVSFDASHNMYIADESMNVVRMIDKNSGIITTVAGNGHGGFSGNGGFATSAELNSPSGISFDAIGNIYITDGSNAQIRKVNLPTGINDLSNKDEIVHVYPNPDNGKFILVVSNTKEKCRVEIFNVAGEKIYSEILKDGGNNTINLTTQPNGIYLYKVFKENGDIVGSGKLIIEK